MFPKLRRGEMLHADGIGPLFPESSSSETAGVGEVARGSGQAASEPIKTPSAMIATIMALSFNTFTSGRIVTWLNSVGRERLRSESAQLSHR
jgi:hypothetical protein